MTPLRRSPLHDRHVGLGAKFGEFGGWEMPLEYAGGGTLKEHAAVREAVGVFDVSHLGTVTVQGAGAAEFLNRCLTNDLRRVRPGQAQYTLCCADDGGVVDDLIAYLHGPDDVFLVPNAANTAAVVGLLRDAAPAGVAVTDVRGDFAIIAVQGPRSAEVVAAVGLPRPDDYMSFTLADEVRVCRSGYTGEHGYELVVPAARAGAVWDALLAAGATLGVRPAGLAARDTLRTELGYPLHGQELSLSISPVQARAGWAVGWDKPAFWGRAALLAERAAGPARVAWGLIALDRAIPRAHLPVLVDGTVVGELTSGTFSPTLRVGIALALIDTSAGLAEGDEVTLDMRGRPARLRLHRPPFVPSHVR